MPTGSLRSRAGAWVRLITKHPRRRASTVKSIFGFWIFYALTVVARAFLGSDPGTILFNKLAVIGAGIIFTCGIYAAIAAFASGATILRKAVVAMIASTAASILMGATLIAGQRGTRRACVSTDA